MYFYDITDLHNSKVKNMIVAVLTIKVCIERRIFMRVITKYKKNKKGGSVNWGLRCLFSICVEYYSRFLPVKAKGKSSPNVYSR